MSSVGLACALACAAKPVACPGGEGVVGCERVPLHALRSTGLCFPRLPTPHVFPVGYVFKVGGVDARPVFATASSGAPRVVVAGVVNVTLGGVAVGNLECLPVGGNGCCAAPKSAVPM